MTICMLVIYGQKIYHMEIDNNNFVVRIVNCHSVILMGAGLPVEDLGFEPLLCQQPTHKVARRRNVGAAPGTCGGGL